MGKSTYLKFQNNSEPYDEAHPRRTASLPLLPYMLLLLASSYMNTMPAAAQKMSAKKLIQRILKKQPDKFGEILDNPDKYRVQILYTQVDRDAENQPHFTSYGYRLNPDKYFYSASTVKLPGALVALEKLNALNIPGLNKYTPLRIDSAYAGQSAVRTYSSSEPAPVHRPLHQEGIARERHRCLKPAI